MSELKESTNYDNFMKEMDEYDSKLKESKPTTLSDVFDDLFEVDDGHPNSWQKHWVGMPEFSQPMNKPFKSILVHCQTEEDYDALSVALDQPLTNKTKFAWYPFKAKDENSLKRWIEE